MRLIFMGTPEFAVASLEILLDNGYDIVAVVTAPDKPGGRQGVQESAVKKFALSRGLKVLQPEKLKNPEFLAELRALQADLQIVVAFRMLPEAVWAMPPLGTMNLHGSLLPKYRGAAPINWAIIRGEKETGVTTFLLQHEIDTGDLLFQEKIPIGPDETAGELHDKMMQIGAKLILKSVQALQHGQAHPVPQANTEATHAPKIFHDTCRLNFDQPAQHIHDFIRGLSPYPGAWTTWEGKTLKIFRSTLQDAGTYPLADREPPGSLLTDGKNYLKVATSDGFISVLELQLEGKKRMSVRDFLNGHPLLNRASNPVQLHFG
ncbi:MAG: methionyl-tRNA formyltransferase [Saprospiraceae bacterium]|nr:methionyl-tRNA formyltransferase [Saprospiraceae bacterium]